MHRRLKVNMAGVKSNRIVEGIKIMNIEIQKC